MRTELAVFRTALTALDPADTLVQADMPPDPWQTDLLRGRPHRALVVASRQTGKSTATAAGAVHAARYNPDACLLIVQPTQRQSSEMLLRARSVALAQPGLELERDAAMSLQIRGGGRILALPGTPTAVRGYTATGVIVDEAAYVADETYRALRPVLAASGGALIALGTPAGRRGWFYRAWVDEPGADEPAGVQDGTEQWTRVAVTADENPRISPAFLASERRQLGELMFQQEYFCQFIAAPNAILDADLLAAASQSVEPGQVSYLDLLKARQAEQLQAVA